MGALSRDISGAGMAAAIEANLVGAAALFSGAPGTEWHNEPELRWCITPGVPSPLFNHVYSTMLPQEGIDARIEEVRERFAARQLPTMWSVGPFTRPSDLGRRLEAHGATHAEDAPGMAIDLRALNENVPSPAELSVERVSDVRSLRQYIDVAKAGFELPDFAAEAFFEVWNALGLAEDGPVRHYVGSLGDEVVATATVVFAAGIAGIFDIVTLPEARRRGVGAAMTLEPLRQARELGYRIGILQSSAMGLGVYRRVGFRQYSNYSIYVWGE